MGTYGYDLMLVGFVLVFNALFHVQPSLPGAIVVIIIGALFIVIPKFIKHHASTGTR